MGATSTLRLLRRGATALLACAAATLAVPALCAASPWRLSRAATAGPNGSIAGTVTDAATKKPIAGIEVCAFSAEETAGEEAEPPCVTTAANGGYSIGAPPGTYLVAFSSPLFGNLNYVPQMYREAANFNEATPVVVAPAAQVTGIDARMHEGGRIAGAVTSAATHAAIAGALVCATQVAGTAEGFGCAQTGAGGEYAILALPEGDYAVHFLAPHGPGGEYASQWYEGAATISAARQVHVTPAATTGGVDAALRPGGRIEGHLRAAPGGGPLPGAIACAVIPVGEGEPVQCAIAGPGGEYGIKRLPPGGYAVLFGDTGYTRQYYNGQASLARATLVTVGEGATVAGIDALLAPDGSTGSGAPGSGPGSPPGLPGSGPGSGVAGLTVHGAAVRILSRALHVRRHRVKVRASCAGAACAGSMELVVHRARRGRAGARTVQTIVLARGSFSVASGSHWVQTLALRRGAARRLAGASRHPLHAQLILTLAGAPTTSVAVRVG
jgi:Carboxypeptidase regulatory-like domain